MKIVFLDASTLGGDADFSPLESLGKLVLYQLTSKEEVASRIYDADVIIVNKVKIGEAEMKSAPNLKLICVAATGTNNIDHNYASKAGVLVKNVSNYSTESVAQVTFATLLSMFNHIYYFDNVVKSGDYSNSPHFTHMGRSFSELKGKNFGIIGMGNIGKRVASIASAFGANVSYFSTSGWAHCKEYPSVTLSELLAKSDVLSIHSPLNDKTHNLITIKELKEMKPTSILINMGRGGIVNEKDLASAINYGLISGAITDVYEEEPIKKDHPYFSIKDKSKIILTPHIGWTSAEARKCLIEKLAENILQIL